MKIEKQFVFEPLVIAIGVDSRANGLSKVGVCGHGEGRIAVVSEGAVLADFRPISNDRNPYLLTRVIFLTDCPYYFYRSPR